MSRSRFTRSFALAGAGFALAVAGTFAAAGTADAGVTCFETTDGKPGCVAVDDGASTSDACFLGSLCSLFGSSSLGSAGDLLGSVPLFGSL